MCYKYRKFGTNRFAIPAVNAIIGPGQERGVVSLFVELLAHLQGVCRAKSNTDFTALTPVSIDMNNAL